MPPRKRRAQAPPTGAAKKPAARPSKLAKENDISASEESEIKEAFELFAIEDDDEGGSVLRIEDVRRVLIALNLPPKSKHEMREILETLDPTSSGTVSYPHFVSVGALKIHARGGEDDGEREEAEAQIRQEVEDAFSLFLGKNRSGMSSQTAGVGGVITLNHLRRIAKELKEEDKVSDEMFKDMILEANGGAGVGKGVNIQDFEEVMRRAGVFR